MKKPLQKQKKSAKKNSPKTVIFGLTGSIACYKVCDCIAQLALEGVRVLCVLSRAAKEFITPLTLASVSGFPVYEDQFMPPPFSKPVHTYLAQEADLIVVAPATADVIAKIATGQADDLLTSTILASRAKMLLAPAMNENMWLNGFTQENVGRLRKAGIEFVEPIRGHLVCQVEGLGHIAAADTILNRIRNLLK